MSETATGFGVTRKSKGWIVCVVDSRIVSAAPTELYEIIPCDEFIFTHSI